MFRVLELIPLDLLCLHSNTVSQYLEQTVRYTYPVSPVGPKEIFRLIQQGPHEISHNLDSVLFADAKLQKKVMSYTCRYRLVSLYKGQLLNYPMSVLGHIPLTRVQYPFKF